MSAHARAEPLGGELLTPTFKVLMAIGALGVVALAVRYTMGLGAASAMTDGYAWGIWIALDVVVGTALGCGGYAMALLVFPRPPRPRIPRGGGGRGARGRLVPPLALPGLRHRLRTALGALLLFGGAGTALQLEGARGRHPDAAVDGVRAVLRILVIFALVTLFHSLFDQKASTCVLQGTRMQLPDWCGSRARRRCSRSTRCS